MHLLEYEKYEEAQRSSKLAIRISITALIITFLSLIASIYYSNKQLRISEINNGQAPKIETKKYNISGDEKEKAIESKQTPDNKPIIKPAPNMLEWEDL